MESEREKGIALKKHKTEGERRVREEGRSVRTEENEMRETGQKKT